jgi:hypothetical protein
MVVAALVEFDCADDRCGREMKRKISIAAKR